MDNTTISVKKWLTSTKWTVHILHTSLHGLALGCQDFKLLDLKKGIVPSSSPKPNLTFIIRSPLHIFFPRTIGFLGINYGIVLFLIDISLYIVKEGK